VLFVKTKNIIKPAPGSSRLVHNKFVLIDNKILVNGSGNWSSTAVSINLENLAVLNHAEVPDILEAFECAFDAFWTGDANMFSNSLSACENQRVRFSPIGQRNPNSVALIVDEIKQAEVSIEIAMHHLTNKDVYRELSAARSRNIEIKILGDDDSCNARENDDLVKLVSEGAKVKYMQTSCELFQLSHNKFGIFDRKKVINGSGNWSKAGLTKNYENFIAFSDNSDVKVFNTFFENAWRDSVTPEECKCDRNTDECKKKYCLGRSF